MSAGSTSIERREPYWWVDAGRPQAPPHAPLPSEVDVVVIGAGLTGLSAARTLARAGKSVLVLDGGAPGCGASSRNGGMIGGGHRLSIDDMAARFGEATAIGLLDEAHLKSHDFVRAVLEDEAIDCDYVEVGRFRGLWNRAEYDAVGKGLERLAALIPLEFEMIPKERQRDEVASDFYTGGALYPRHGGLNPAKWTAGLLAAAQRAGAMVQGDTPVQGLQKDGAAFRVETLRGAVLAGSALAAVNGYADAALPEQRRRMTPIPSFIVATEPLGANRIRALFPNGRMVVESRERHCYYRPSPDGQRLVFGGRAAMFDAPERFTTSELARLMREIFPDLGAVAFSHAWRGRTGFSFDFLPHVGQIDGVWHAMGYSGSGNAMAPYLGHKAALQILGDPEGETAFSKTTPPTRWWKPGGAWFLPFADLLFRGRDLVANRKRGV